MQTFGACGREGLYIGPSPKHYRCYCCINSSSGCPIDADTVEFIPHEIPFPSVTADDYLRQVTTDILHILQNPQNKISSLTFGSPTTNAFIHLARILKRSTTPSQRKSPLTVVPKSDPVSSPRVNHNVAPLSKVQHINMVPLAVPKNNPVSSPRVHQSMVIPLEVVQHNKKLQLTAPINNPIFSPRVPHKVAPLETVQYINEVLKSGVPKANHTTIDPYTHIQKLFPFPPPETPQLLYMLKYKHIYGSKFD